MEYNERVFISKDAVRASSVYQESEKKPMTERTAKIAMTTMSSAIVKAFVLLSVFMRVFKKGKAVNPFWRSSQRTGTVSVIFTENQQKPVVFAAIRERLKNRR